MITILIIIATTIVSIMAFKNRMLFYKLALNPYSVVRKKQWYRMVSCSLIHADYTHLILNMFVLWSFGGNLEVSFKFFAAEGLIAFPALTYLILYVGGVLFSSLPDVMSNKKDNAMYNSIGASGGVSAILFASIFISPWSNLYFFFIIPIPKIVFGIAYLAYSHYMDKKSKGNVNHKAHIYGALFGLLYMSLLNFEFVSRFLRKLTSFL